MRNLITPLLIASPLLMTACSPSLVITAMLLDQLFNPEAAIFDAGTSVACLGTTADPGDYTDATGLISVRGEVIAEGLYEGESSNDAIGGDILGNVHPCWTTPSRVLVLEDSAGERWAVGFAWFGPDAAWDQTPEIYVNAAGMGWSGDAVEMIFRGSAETDAAGFALYRENSLIYMLESGINGAGLQDGDVPELTVRQGEVLTSESLDCGERTSQFLSFTSDTDQINLGPNGDTWFYASGDSFMLCNINSIAQDAACGDTENSYIAFQ